jgi:hypothetical protein
MTGSVLLVTSDQTYYNLVENKQLVFSTTIYGTPWINCQTSVKHEIQIVQAPLKAGRQQVSFFLI